MQVFGCRKKMSSIAILDYGGANELYARMQQLAQQGRLDFQRQATELGGLVPQKQQPPHVRTSSARLGCLAKQFCRSCSNVHKVLQHHSMQHVWLKRSTLRKPL